MIWVLFGILLCLILWDIWEWIGRSIKEGFKWAQNNFRVNLDSKFIDSVKEELEKMALQKVYSEVQSATAAVKLEVKNARKAAQMRRKRAEAKAKNVARTTQAKWRVARPKK